MDREGVRQCPVIRIRNLLDSHDPRARWSDFERSAQPFQRSRLAAHRNLDITIREIRDPAAEPEPPSFLAREPAKPDSLHSSANSQV